jgi:hypothetical protein
MNVVVPAYYNSGQTQDWNNFIASLPDANNGGRAMYIVVTGQHSEPDNAFDTVLEGHIAAMRAKGHYILGYVDWMPKTGPCAGHNPVHDCSGRWAALPNTCTGSCIRQYASDNIARWTYTTTINGVTHGYHLQGVFIDDSHRNDISDLSNAENLAYFAQAGVGWRFDFYGTAFVFFNWGASPPAIKTYVDCSIQKIPDSYLIRWITYENTAQNLRNEPTANYEWSFSYVPLHFVQLGYGYDTSPDWTALDDTMAKAAMRNSQGFFVTDKPGWSTPPRADLLARENYNGGFGYQFPGDTSDVIQCAPNNCSGSCMTCNCPTPGFGL